MFMFICSLLVFPDIPSWTVCQQEDGDDDAHQEQYGDIEPERLDVPGSDNLLTAVERCTTALATRRQVDNAHTGHEMTVDDIKHLTLVGSDDTVLQFDVIVLSFQVE